MGHILMYEGLLYTILEESVEGGNVKFRPRKEYISQIVEDRAETTDQ